MKFLGNPSSGSQAGTTFSHNRAGQYTRSRRTPVNAPGTGRKGIVKAAFGAASSAWAALTSAVQASWTAYANSYPITDALGQSITLTGHQMFTAVNAMLQNCGAAISSTPPVSQTVGSPGAVTFTAVSAGAITVTPTGTGAAGDFMLISFSAPLSSGVSFNATWWQATHVAGNSSAAYVATTAYHAQFGIPAVGRRIFAKVTPVNQYGVKGTPVIVLATVS